MKTRPALSIAAVIAAFALASCSETALVFQIQDSVSGAWVGDATARIQDRLLKSYYQTDAGPIPQKLSHLKPGPATLEITAPGYLPVSIPVTLRPGKNRLPSPVEMIGREIPGLSGFSIFETVENGDIAAEVRPLDGVGKAIVNHPCIDLWIGALVSEQVTGGVPDRSEGSAGAKRGGVLFRGVLRWSWDARPESLFRYSARIPSSDMEASPSLYRVIDYLVVVPDPSKVSKPELEGIMADAWPSGGLTAGNPSRSETERLAPALAAALAAHAGRLRWFLVTSWDVRARQS